MPIKTNMVVTQHLVAAAEGGHLEGFDRLLKAKSRCWQLGGR